MACYWRSVAQAWGGKTLRFPTRSFTVCGPTRVWRRVNTMEAFENSVEFISDRLVVIGMVHARRAYLGCSTLQEAVCEATC